MVVDILQQFSKYEKNRQLAITLIFMEKQHILLESINEL